MMNLPPLFNAQFFDDDGTPLNAGLLYTYISGTTTDQATYEDEAGLTPNTNPIVLNARGECVLWLDSALVYTLLLKRADTTTVWTRDDIQATATGALTQADLTAYTADDIDYTTGTGTTWFSGTKVASGMDSIITRLDAPPASSVTILDAGGYITGTTVETAIQELGAVKPATLTGNSGALLTTNGSTTSWLPRLSLWNVTYVSTAYATDDTFTLPLNTIGVYVSSRCIGAFNSGAVGAVEIYTGGTLSGTCHVNGTNIGNGGDGGSGMTDGAGAFVPIKSGATSIKFIRVSGTGTVNPTFILHAHVTIA